MICLMIRQPPRSTLTDTLVPYSPLVRSHFAPKRPNDFQADRRAVVLLGRIGNGLDLSHRADDLADRDPPPLAREADDIAHAVDARSEEHTSELQSLMRRSYAVFCSKIKNHIKLFYHSTPLPASFIP